MNYATKFRKPIGSDIDATGWRPDPLNDGVYSYGADYGTSAPSGPRGRGETIHMAVDWNMGSTDDEIGEPVFAVANGTVEFVGSPTGWDGQVIVLRHELPPGMTSPSGGQFVYSVYAHLRNASVVEGGSVAIGDQIAEIGDPANFSAHLHFEMRSSWTGIDDGYAEDVNGTQQGGSRDWFDPAPFTTDHQADAITDDYANGSATSGKLEIGVVNKDQAWGVLEERPEGEFDTDWFAVDLEAGKTYTFALRGADTASQTQGAPTLADPSLRIRDPQGNQITWDGQPWESGQQTADDGAGGRDVRVSFTATKTGTHHLVAFSASGETGSYRLSGVESDASGGGVAPGGSGSESTTEGSFPGDGPVISEDMTPPIKIGDEFLVNTTTQNNQYSPAITALSDGRFVVAWTDDSQTGGDTLGGAIRAQVFNADGTIAGGEFLANTTQSSPIITALDDGAFVVAWTNRDLDESGWQSDTRAQVYNANGAKMGDEILLYDETQGLLFDQTIAALSDDRFAFAWSGFGENGDFSIVVAVFDTEGRKVGDDVLVSTASQGVLGNPAVTALSDGRLLIAWECLGEANCPADAIHAQIFAVNGSKFGEEFFVSSATFGLNQHLTVTALSDDTVVVAWTDWSATAGDSSGSSIRAQIFQTDGTRIGEDFLVNTTTTDWQNVGGIITLGDDRFVVVWDDNSRSGGDTWGYAIRAQVFNSDGSKAGDEFLVSTTIQKDQQSPTITALTDGRFVVAWMDDSQTGGDTSGSAIRAQIFDANGIGVIDPTSDAIIIDDNVNLPHTELQDVTLQDLTLLLWKENADYKGRFVDGAGQPAGVEFTLGAGNDLATADLGDGRVLVHWLNNGTVLGRIVQADGSFGAEMTLETLGASWGGTRPDMSYYGQSDGSFWQVYNGPTGGGFDISWRVTKFDSAGNELFSSNWGNDAPWDADGTFIRADLTILDNDRFVEGWSSEYLGRLTARMFDIDVVAQNIGEAGSYDLQLAGQEPLALYTQTLTNNALMILWIDTSGPSDTGSVSASVLGANGPKADTLDLGFANKEIDPRRDLSVTELPNGQIMVMWKDDAADVLRGGLINSDGTSASGSLSFGAYAFDMRVTDFGAVLAGDKAFVYWLNASGELVGQFTNAETATVLEASPLEQIQVVALENGDVMVIGADTKPLFSENPLDSQVIGRIVELGESANTNQAPTFTATTTEILARVGEQAGTLDANGEIVGAEFFSTLGIHYDDPDGDTLTYAITEGALPAGLTLDTATGRLVGSVTADPGDYSFTLTATDPDGASVSGNFSIAVLSERLPLTSFDYEYMAKIVAYGRGTDMLPEGFTAGPEISGAGDFHAIPITSPDGQAVLAIRGTASLLDVVTDADIFGIGYTQARVMWPQIQTWLEDHPGAHIVGHSLGGAQAQLVAAWATDVGLTVGDITTFNSPGINDSQAVLFNSDLAGTVTHFVVSGDVVSMAGDGFLPGDVNFYDFDVLNLLARIPTTLVTNPAGVLISASGIYGHVVQTHTGHWAQPEMWSLGYSDFDELTGYELASTTLTSADLSSGLFSHLYSGDSIDVEYGKILLSFAHIGLPGVSVALATRAGTETLRDATGLLNWGPILFSLQQADLRQTVIDAISQFGETLNSWGGSLVQTLANAFTPTTWSIIATLGVEALQAAANWTESTIRGIANWGMESLDAVRDWGVSAWAELSSWSDVAMNAAAEWTTDMFRSVGTFGVSAWQGAIATVDAFNSAVVNFADSSYTNFMSTAEGLGRWVVNGTANIVSFGSNSLQSPTESSIVVANSTGSTLQSGQGSLFVAGPSTDFAILQGNRNTVIGSSVGLNGDVISGFNTSDRLILLGEWITSDNLLVEQGSAILRIDSDADGEFETTVRLEGDFDISAFHVEQGESGTIFTYVPDSLIRTDAPDTLIGTSGDDVLRGGGGDDGVFGQAGNDILDGGAGNDSIAGADGNDVITGGPGNDNIGGGQGNDTIDGGEGDDIMGAGFGDDSVSGGLGNDVVAGGAGNDTLDGGDGNDSMSGSFGNDLIDAGSEADDIGGGTGRDTIDAGAGNDRVGGGEGDDSILGGAGNDFLAGGGRNDTIDGGTGNDTINGGAGSDVMTGGAGADQFVFSSFFDGDGDVITDFEDGTDSFFIRRFDPDTGDANIDNGGNGLAGFVAAMNITDTAAGAQMNVNGNTILVEGITAAQLTVEDFQFL